MPLSNKGLVLSSKAASENPPYVELTVSGLCLSTELSHSSAPVATMLSSLKHPKETAQPQGNPRKHPTTVVPIPGPRCPLRILNSAPRTRPLPDAPDQQPASALHHLYSQMTSWTELEFPMKVFWCILFYFIVSFFVFRNNGN